MSGWAFITDEEFNDTERGAVDSAVEKFHAFDAGSFEMVGTDDDDHPTFFLTLFTVEDFEIAVFRHFRGVNPNGDRSVVAWRVAPQ